MLTRAGDEAHTWGSARTGIIESIAAAVTVAHMRMRVITVCMPGTGPGCVTGMIEETACKVKGLQMQAFYNSFIPL
jgi:hypothetical protein